MSEVEIDGFGVANIVRTDGCHGVVTLELEQPRVELWLDEARELGESLIAAASQDDPKPEIRTSGLDTFPEVWATDAHQQRLALLEAAIEAQVPVEFEYTDFEGVETQRVVSPYEIVEYTENGLEGAHHVKAWDHNREDFRQFRIARIGAIGPAATEFDANATLG